MIPELVVNHIKESPETCRVLAHRLGMSATTVSRIRLGRRTETPQGRRNRRFGLTQIVFDAMRESQCDRCAICHEPFKKSPCVDHDHSTGAVRGLLCNYCNSGLGYLRDNPLFCLSAAEYLVNHKDDPSPVGTVLSTEPETRRPRLSRTGLPRERSQAIRKQIELDPNQTSAQVVEALARNGIPNIAHAIAHQYLLQFKGEAIYSFIEAHPTATTEDVVIGLRAAGLIVKRQAVALRLRRKKQSA